MPGNSWTSRGRKGPQAPSSVTGHQIFKVLRQEALVPSLVCSLQESETADDPQQTHCGQVCRAVSSQPSQLSPQGQRQTGDTPQAPLAKITLAWAGCAFRLHKGKQHREKPHVGRGGDRETTRREEAGMQETAAHLLEQTPRPLGSSARNPVYALCARQMPALGKEFH